MNKKFLFVGIACAMFSTALMNAQTAEVAPTRPAPASMIARQVTRYSTLLNLNAEQQSQATAILTTEHTAISGVRANMRTAEKALRTAVDNNDTGGIAAAANQIGTLTAQEVQAHATAQAAFYAALNSTQQAAYKQLGPMGMGGPEGMHHGFGGPGGPAGLQ
ncbi:MAG TPA: Spy/CpxP family protein refolding chaperone [Bryobacteraceae bacterium]|jgi:Spy/CpxP family protein refolding chaperone|nr:Spy/CpxP family protein refolding chaperone [Bryobacteraceae bacterium]